MDPITLKSALIQSGETHHPDGRRELAVAELRIAIRRLREWCDTHGYLQEGMQSVPVCRLTDLSAQILRFNAEANACYHLADSKSRREDGDDLYQQRRERRLRREAEATNR